MSLKKYGRTFCRKFLFLNETLCNDCKGGGSNNGILNKIVILQCSWTLQQFVSRMEVDTAFLN